MLAVSGVEIILDAIIRAAWELFSNVGPFIPKLFVEFEDLALFVLTDRIFIDVRV